MKCPICATKLLPNESVCPNCGMTVRKDNITQTTKDTTYKTNQSYQFKEKPKYLHSDLSTGQKINRISRLILIGSLLIACIIFVIVPLFRQAAINHSYTEISSMTFQEVIDEGYDEKDTVKNLIAYIDDYILYLNDCGYTVDFKTDTCSKEMANTPLAATTSFQVTIKENKSYAEVAITFKNGELYSTKLIYDGYSGDINEIPPSPQLLLTEEEVTPLAVKLGMDDAYKELKHGHSELNENNEGEFIYDYRGIGIYNIYMSEVSKQISDIPFGYSYYYSIERVWVI